MNPGLLRLDADIVYFPVRHYSPAAARIVRLLIERLQPSCVLIEGPSEYNPFLEELLLPHTLPVALYIYVQLADGARSGAFYPFCDYSPEWQALSACGSQNIPFAFIDLPWARMVQAFGVEEGAPVLQRYADGPLRQSEYVERLCRELGLEDIDSLWDTLFEIDGGLSPEDYMARCHALCYSIRLSDGVSELDWRREAFMARQIAEARDTPGRSGPVLAVTGGFHSHGLLERLESGDFLPETSGPEPEQQGISLTPFTYQRLDSLGGYEAGMPNPGFYDAVWNSRSSAKRSEPAWRGLLALAAERLRGRKQIVSAADLIAVETMARGLGCLRGHSEVWRTDLTDGILTALIKEELSQGGPLHPLLQEVRLLLRGDRRGSLAEGCRLPPLAAAIKERLSQEGLLPEEKEREEIFDLTGPDGLAKSRLLHSLRVLQIPGFERVGGVDFAARKDTSRLLEQWHIAWIPGFEAGCIEASLYGGSLPEAAAARLQERLEREERDASAAALSLLDAALMGLQNLRTDLMDRVTALIREEADLFRLSRSLGHLLYLYRYDEALGSAGGQEAGQALAEAWERALWLLEALGTGAGTERETAGAIAVLVETFERCGRSLGLSRRELAAVLKRLDEREGLLPQIRGAASGALWSLGETDTGGLQQRLKGFCGPNSLGDYLTGLFTLAREAVQRSPDLMVQIDSLVMDFTPEEFLSALPALRLAFSYFAPREKGHMARSLMEAVGEGGAAPLPALKIDTAAALRAMALEAQIEETLKKYGLRRGGAK